MSQRKFFSKWLLQQKHRDDPIGDLAKDVARDSGAPLGAFRIKRWLEYLRSKNACDGAIDALREAFKEFTRHNS